MTTNARSALAVTVFSVDVDSVWPPGCAFVETMFVPWMPARRAAGRGAAEPLEHEAHRLLA